MQSLATIRRSHSVMTQRLHTTNTLALPCRARRVLAVAAREAVQESTWSAAFIGGFAAT